MSASTQVLFRFRFRVPPHFALVIRALGALEGTVIRVDPNFKVVARAYPYVLNQVLRDKRPQMRKVRSLSELLFVLFFCLECWTVSLLVDQ